MSARRIAPALALAALAAAVAPGLAYGSTATVASGTLTYAAAAGETNNATLSREGGNFRIVDPGAPITPMAGCAAVNANEVICGASGVTSSVRLLLGNMNDSGTIAASVTGSFTGDLRGDAGNDVLRNEADLFFTFLIGDESADPPGNDTLTGGPSRDSVRGNQGDDTADGGAGGDDIDEGPGNDTLIGGEGDDRLGGGPAANGADTFVGGPGFDDAQFGDRVADLRLTADAVADDGEPGEADNLMPDLERLSAGEGDDTLAGGPGLNQLQGEDGNDSADGGDGPDDVEGGRGNDSVAGGAGNDTLRPGLGPDTANGGEGDDTLVTGEFEDEPDVLGGGPGADRADFEFANGPVTVTLDDVADDGLPGEGDNVMADVEDVTGGPGADTIVGNAAANQLSGGDGDDTIAGLGGPDGLDGERGNDSLDGGDGTDLLAGAAGGDRLRSRDSGPDEASCGAGADAVLADLDDAPDADCETTSTGVAFEKSKAKVSSGKAKLALSCPAVEAVDCEGKLTLRKGKKKLGSKRLSIASGDAENVSVKLKGKAPKGAVDAAAVITDAAGAKATSERKVKLAGKGKS